MSDCSDDVRPSAFVRKYSLVRRRYKLHGNDSDRENYTREDAVERRGENAHRKSPALQRLRIGNASASAVDRWTDDGFDEYFATFEFGASRTPAGSNAIIDDSGTTKAGRRTPFSTYERDGKTYTRALGNTAVSSFATVNKYRASTPSGSNGFGSPITNDYIALRRLRGEYLVLRSNFNAQYANLKLWLTTITRDFRRMGLDLNLVDFLFLPVDEISTVLSQKPSSIIDFTRVDRYNQKEIVIQLLMELRQNVFERRLDWIRKSRFILENTLRLNIFVSKFLINRIIELC